MKNNSLMYNLTKLRPRYGHKHTKYKMSQYDSGYMK